MSIGKDTTRKSYVQHDRVRADGPNDLETAKTRR